MSEISCTNCIGACCRNVIIELSRKEQKLIEKAGTHLVTIAKPKQRDREKVLYPYGSRIDEKTGNKVPLYMRGHEYAPLAAGLGRFMINGECGYLKTDDEGWQSCSIYDERPEACRNFEVGGHKCRLLRVLYGVDAPSPDVPDLREFDTSILVDRDQLSN